MTKILMEQKEELIISQDRKFMSARAISLLWAGITFCLPSFMLGGILIPALSLSQALLITAAGNLAVSLLILLMGIPGVDKGWSSALLNRSVFGYPFGTIIPSFAVTTSMIGWGAILLALSGHALSEIMRSVTGAAQPELFMVITGVAVMASSMSGPQRMSLISKISMPALFLWCAWVFYVLFNRYGLTSLLTFQANGSLSLGQAFDLVIGGTIAGVFVSSDLARFAHGRSALGWGVMAGSTLVAVIMAVLGMLSQLATGSWNPVQVVESLGLGIPAMILIFLSTLTTNQAILYSGGVAMSNFFLPLNHKLSTLVLGFLMIILAVTEVTDHFENFLLLLDHLFAPMTGVVLAHFFLLSQPYRIIKINWPALMAVGAGIICPHFLSTLLPTSLFSLAVSALVYVIVSKTVEVVKSNTVNL